MAFNNIKNYYEILGVSPNVQTAEIKSVYRRLVRKYHPDINKSPDAIETFKQITMAYETLSDLKKREQYNILNGIFPESEKAQRTTVKTETCPNSKNARFTKKAHSEKSTSESDSRCFSKKYDKAVNVTPKRDFNFSLLRLFKAWLIKFKRYKYAKDLNKPQKGADISTEVVITPMDVITGTKKVINILTTHTCPKCGGRKFLNGAKCFNCNGTGEVSNRKKITVTIPKGVKDGAKLRLRGEGGIGLNGAPSGDLYIAIKVDIVSKIRFDKLNIYYEVPITPFEAALGEEIKIPVFDGVVNLKLPKNTCSGQKFRIANQGIKKNGKTGDLIITVSIEFSQDLSDDEIKLYQKLKNLSKDDLRKNIINGN